MCVCVSVCLCVCVCIITTGIMVVRVYEYTVSEVAVYVNRCCGFNGGVVHLCCILLLHTLSLGTVI